MAETFRDLFGDWAATADGTSTVLTVETYDGESARGPVFLAPRQSAPMVIAAKATLTRTATGEELAGDTEAHGDLVDAPLLTLRSRVTLPDGRVRTVIAVDTFDVQGFPPVLTVRMG